MSITSYGALLDAVQGVHWPARRAVTSAFAGSHQSKVRGTSAEFTEYRLYRQGDDPRRLDWRLLARSDRAYIRLATDRAVLPTTIVADSSASMAFPVESHDKWMRAKEIAVGLAAVAHADGDPVGVAVHVDGSVRLLPPRTRRGVVHEIASTLDDAHPHGSPSIAALLRLTRTARVALITDLLGDADDLIKLAGAHVASGGEVLVVHIVADEEIDPPRRVILAADPEELTLQRMLIDGTRREYSDAFLRWRTDMARRWRALGAVYHEIRTSEPAAHAVRRLVDPAPAAVLAR